MKYDIRTYSSYNPNKIGSGTQFGADFVKNPNTNKAKLVSVANNLSSHQQAVNTAKKFIEKHGEKGDSITAINGNIYRYTGKNWRVDKPSNPML